MKKFLIPTVLCLALSCSQAVKEDRISTIVPYPNNVEVEEGTFKAKGAAVSYDASLDEATVNIIKGFADRLSEASGSKIVVSEGPADKGFVFVADAQIPSEAYVLDVNPDVVEVRASDLRGFNYAVQTIKQMLPVEIFGSKAAPRADWTMQCALINDAPRFAYRGLHLDEGRHFFGVDQVKKYLDIMEAHKLNKFHWHLTEDQGWRIEIKKYPLLTEVGAVRKGTCVKKDFDSHDGVPYGEGLWYSHEQIREIVEYAASKGIDVIPEIDIPGHMLAALAAYPELGCTGGPYEVWTRWGVADDVLCAGNDKIYTFLEDVLSEVCDLFPYEYVHVGGDECPKVRWEKCPKCQAKIKALGLKDKDGHKAEHFLQSHVMMRMEQFLNAKGKKIIGWDEILEGEIAPNATIMSWRGEAGGLEATRLGHDAIMTPNTYFYLDYYQSADIENEPFGIGGYLPVEVCYSYEPYVQGMTDEQKAHILGVQANLWTEYIKTADHLEYMLLPRLAALSEVQWCDADNKDWDRFFEASGSLLSKYDMMGCNYATHILQVDGTVKVDQENGCMVVELKAQGDDPVRYTLDGSDPDRSSKLYTEPVKLTESCVFKAAVFRDGLEPVVFTRKCDFHKASGKKITFSRAAHRAYCKGGTDALVDGIRGTEQFKGIEWIGWYAAPFHVDIEMGGAESYSSVTVGLLNHKPSFIFLPERISVSVSEDGQTYTEVAAEDYGVEKKDNPDGLTELTLSFPETSAKYVRVAMVPVEKLPEWHHAAGSRSFIFVDEIIVK